MARRQKGEAKVDALVSTLEQLDVVYVPTNSILPNEYNPNRQNDHDFQLLMRSMEEDGFTQPIIVHRESNRIVDGEHRWRAAHKLELAEVPVVFVDMTEEQMRISTLRHNRARGSEDLDLAASVLRDLQKLGALEWAQESLMINDVELQRMMEDVSAVDALAGEDWNTAWEPASPDTEGEIAKGVDAIEVTDAADGITKTTAMSKAAVAVVEKQQEDLKAAKTQEERSLIRQANQPFRLMLLFQGPEADLVKRVLGVQPAEKLIEVLNAWNQREVA